MKKLNKEKMKGIMAGGPICLECPLGYIKIVVQGKCYCVSQE